MEPAIIAEPGEGYLAAIRKLATRHGTVLIFDERITGFPWNLRGAQAYFDVAPDLAMFGKALANGLSVAVLLGRRDIMRVGSTVPGQAKMYFLSSTHGGETHGLAAAMTTSHELEQRRVNAHI
jgi:glutamate-1-semialdehyde 2,1-aminomutase